MGKEILDLALGWSSDGRRDAGPRRGAVAAEAPGRRPVTRSGRDRPSGGFELWSWLFMRICGLVLLVLAVGHVLIMHVLDEGVDRVDFGFVADALGQPVLADVGLGAAGPGADPRRSTACASSCRTTSARRALRLAVNMFFYVLGLRAVRARHRHRVHVRPVDVAGDGLRRDHHPHVRRGDRRRRRRRPAGRDRGLGHVQHRRDLQALPDALAHRRGAGRDVRGARATSRRTRPSGTRSTR